MKTATQTLELSKRYPPALFAPMIAEAGFEGADLSMTAFQEHLFPLSASDMQNYTKALSLAFNGAGIPLVQSHAPYKWSSYSLEHHERVILPATVQCIEIACALEIPVCVVHPIHNLPFEGENPALLFEQNLEFYGKLLHLTRHTGVIIALENMWKKNKLTGVIGEDVCARPLEFARYIDALNDRRICACLDIGHLGLCKKEPEDVVLTLGSRIKCLHLHDNDLCTDLHTLPFSGLIDLDGAARALAATGYAGNITLEADKYLEGARDGGELTRRLSQLSESAEKFRNRIKYYRSNASGERK